MNLIRMSATTSHMLDGVVFLINLILDIHLVDLTIICIFLRLALITLKIRQVSL